MGRRAAQKKVTVVFDDYCHESGETRHISREEIVDVSDLSSNIENISAEMKAKIQENLEAALTEKLTSMENIVSEFVNTSMDGIIASVMGIERDYGDGWRCKSGSMVSTSLTRHLVPLVDAHLRELDIPKIAKKIINEKVTLKLLSDNMKDSVLYDFRRKLDEKIREEVEKLASEVSEEAVANAREKLIEQGVLKRKA